MRVAIIGTGYVGLVTGACFAEVGHEVICMDTADEKIDSLKAGTILIYEDGLQAMVARNSGAGRLRFTTSLAAAVAEADVLFLAVGTPQGEDGSADLSMILGAAEQIGAVMDHELIVVQKSTCPVGTTRGIERRVRKALSARGLKIHFSVVSNPEFLREGSAVRDFMEPDRVVIGADDADTGKRVASLYAKIAPVGRVLMMDPASAELTKYAANAFLATKISFINEIANLCEAVGADVEDVRRGIGTDSRIGPAFLAAGIGYGGSCFPKDVKALVRTGQDYGCRLQILESAEQVNPQQRARQVEKILGRFGGSLAGKRIAIWGLAFKPGTDDMREAPAVPVSQSLLDFGADVVAYDPAAIETGRAALNERVVLAPSALECVAGADAVVLMTEWPQFKALDLDVMAARMRQPVLFDFRNGFDPDRAAAAGFEYYGVGRAAQASRVMAAVGQ
ncbi:MAG: UDP-glucose dehydrogenase family protein [Symbiobacteriia bacterium]